MIYLDNAATTKIAPEVLDAMMPYLTEQYGNAGSLYKAGRDARDAVEKARTQVSGLFSCDPSQIVFTSGGSESNSMVFAGLRRKLLEAGKTHIVVSSIEHDSVIKAAKMLTKDGFDITFVKPSADGTISERTVESEIRETTGLVSVMFVNNETGAVNDVAAIGNVCRKKGVLFHTDCVQAAGQYNLAMDDCMADFASISSHKTHGPKGVGALYVRNMDSLDPIICGGAEQEHGLRGGTENVAGIVGFGTAAQIALQNDMETISFLKQRFYMALIYELENLGITNGSIHVNGNPTVAPGKVLNLTIDGVDAQTLLLMLYTMGVCVSAGSACRSHESEPSHVLMAMGRTAEQARSSVRVSFSKYNTTDEVEGAAKVFADCVYTLKNM